jgi:hypothetical protein
MRADGVAPELRAAGHEKDRVKTIVAIFAALLVCAAMFILPHHKREAGKFQSGAFTLLDILRDMLDSFGDLQSPRAVVFAMISVASLALIFWPVMLVVIVRLTSGEPGPRAAAADRRRRQRRGGGGELFDDGFFANQHRFWRYACEREDDDVDLDCAAGAGGDGDRGGGGGVFAAVACGVCCCADVRGFVKPLTAEAASPDGGEEQVGD